MTNLIKIANENIKLIKLRMEFMTQSEIDSAVKTINQLRKLKL